MPRAVRSAFLCLLLALSLTALPALAGAHRRAQPVRFAPKTTVSTSPASWLWSTLIAVFARSGAEMDPDGTRSAQPAAPLITSTQPPPPTTNLGAEMDPDG